MPLRPDGGALPSAGRVAGGPAHRVKHFARIPSSILHSTRRGLETPSLGDAVAHETRSPPSCPKHGDGLSRSPSRRAAHLAPAAHAVAAWPRTWAAIVAATSAGGADF